MLTDQTSPASQPELFDHGRHARETRAAAATAATEKAPSRRDRIESFIRSRGSAGATRHEIANAMRLPIQSVTSPVLQLLRAGILKEDGRKRPTQYGSQAAVIVSAEIAGR